MKMISALVLGLSLVFAPVPSKAIDPASAGIIGMTLGIILGSQIPSHHLYHPQSHYHRRPGSYMNHGNIVFHVPPHIHCAWMPIMVNEQCVGYYKECR